jgi:hypothetical protein
MRSSPLKTAARTENEKDDEELFSIDEEEVIEPAVAPVFIK